MRDGDQGRGGLLLAIGAGAVNWIENPDAGRVREFARVVDGGELDFVTFIDHIVMPWPEADGTPRSPYPADTDIVEAVVAMGFVAAVTRRVRLRTGILVLPQRNPAVLAKQLAAVDLLSGGRLDVGLGVGWVDAEFDALGVPFGERGERTDEALEVMTRLWDEGSASFDGKHYRLDAMAMEPKPTQRPHPPLWFGGTGPATFRRMVRWGVGWIAPIWADVNDLGRALEDIEQAASDVGRDPGEFRVHAAVRIGEGQSTEDIIDQARRLVSAGASDLMFISGDPPSGGPSSPQEKALRRVCEEIAPTLRSLYVERRSDRHERSPCQP